MESDEWDEKALLALIGPQPVEESQTLEYKAADAIHDKAEISKDISAMANAAGGTIIYGIAEFADKAQEHYVRVLPGDVERIGHSIELASVENSRIVSIPIEWKVFADSSPQRS